MNAPSNAPRGDKARVTVFVAVPQAVAFELFTRDIDSWWRRGPRYRASGRHDGTLCFEPGVGGRLYERFDGDDGPRTVDIGRILVWDPPAQLQLEWRLSNFAPHERTEVEVRFDAVGDGTQVSVEHRGWSTLPPDHPARHGLDGAGTTRIIGLWWGQLLSALRETAAAAERTPPSSSE
jgi:uncharacterized protein YndB with AHSA1/START domain